MQHVECNWKVSIWKRLHRAVKGARDTHELAGECKEAGEGQDRDCSGTNQHTLWLQLFSAAQMWAKQSQIPSWGSTVKEGQEDNAARDCFCLTNRRIDEQVEKGGMQPTGRDGNINSLILSLGGHVRDYALWLLLLHERSIIHTAEVSVPSCFQKPLETFVSLKCLSWYCSDDIILIFNFQ